MLATNKSLSVVDIINILDFIISVDNYNANINQPTTDDVNEIKQKLDNIERKVDELMRGIKV